mgnify:CR=1 FL=1
MAGHGDSHSHDLGHIIPYKTYLNVLLILLFLTIVTVAVSRVEFGAFNIVVALLVASVKAGIVGLYFMHLKYENPLVWIYVAFPIILLVIMIGGIFIDNPLRNDPKIYHEHTISKDSAPDHH